MMLSGIIRGLGKGSSLSGYLTSGCLNRLHDLHITRAAADISMEPAADLLFGGVGIFIQEGFGRQDHPRGAETALHGKMIDESLLQGVQVPFFSQPFDGQNLFPLGLSRQQEAAFDCPAVQENRAGAAISIVAAQFGSR
jgi:hypothetical protein